MAYSIKQMWSAVAVSLVTTTSFVGAHVIGNGPCCYDVCPPNYCNSWCGDLSVSLEALVWKATEDGLAYGIEVDVPPGLSTITPATTSTFVESKVKHPHFKWDWGFRLGIAYALPCDCWGLALVWTDFNTHGTSRFNEFAGTDAVTGTSSFFIPTWGRRDLTGINNTEARLKLRYDTLDLELGRPFCISQCLTLRPHIGVRGAWIRQHYRIDNSVIAIVGVTPIDRPVQEVRLKCDYEAVGLRGGLDSQWDLGCGVSLYGQAAASVLYGRYDIKSEDDYSIIDGGTTNFFFIEQRDEFWACRAVTDLALGIQWRQCFCNDAIALTCSIDWEHHLFFDLNEFEDFVQLTGDFPTDLSDDDFTFGQVKNPEHVRGNFCVKGVAFGVRMDF